MSQQNHYRRPQYSPERKSAPRNRSEKIAKKLASLSLALTLLLTGAAFALANPEDTKDAIDNTKKFFGFDNDLITDRNPNADIIFDIDKYEQDSSNPDKLVYENGIEEKTLEHRQLEDDEVIVIKEGASFRTSPVVGDGESLVTTVASAKKEIILTDVRDYWYYSTENDYADHFLSMKVNELPEELKEEINYDKVDRLFIKAGEAIIEKRSTVADESTDRQSEQEPVVG